MLKRFKIVGLCLVAVFALSAMAAGTASANPPKWWRCVVGTPTESPPCPGSTEKQEELGSGVREKFTSHIKTGTVKELKVPGVVTIVCTGETDEGYIEGKGAANPGTDMLVKKVFTGCTVKEKSGCSVKSPGAASGTIELKSNISSVLEWAKSTGNEALDKLGTAGVEFVKLEFTGTGCPLITKSEVKGEVLGKLLPVGTYAKEGELVFPCPAITRYWEGEPRVEKGLTEVLNAFGFPAEFCDQDIIVSELHPITVK